MKESIRDYNEEFGTSYTLENIRAYNNDVNARLARKNDRYNAQSEQLDLVIVVNRDIYTDIFFKSKSNSHKTCRISQKWTLGDIN